MNYGYSERTNIESNRKRFKGKTQEKNKQKIRSQNWTTTKEIFISNKLNVVYNRVFCDILLLHWSNNTGQLTLLIYNMDFSFEI